MVGGSFDSSFLPLCGALGSASQTVWKDTHKPSTTPTGKALSGSGKNEWGQNGPPEWVRWLLPLSFRLPHTSSPSSKVPCALPGGRQGHQQLQDQRPRSSQKQAQAVYQKPADVRSQDMAMNVLGITSCAGGDEITPKAISEKCLEGRMKAC